MKYCRNMHVSNAAIISASLISVMNHQVTGSSGYRSHVPFTSSLNDERQNLSSGHFSLVFLFVLELEVGAEKGDNGRLTYCNAQRRHHCYRWSRSWLILPSGEYYTQCIRYRQVQPAARFPRIACRQALWLAGMWTPLGCRRAPVALQPILSKWRRRLSD